MEKITKTDIITSKHFNFFKLAIKDWKFWTKLLIGFLQITSVIIFLIVASAIEGNVYAIPETLSYFTTLSNIFCGGFFIYSALFHHNEGKGKFDNSEVAKIAITYVTLTILIYNINQLIAAHPYAFDSWKYFMSLVCEHTLVPILGILYYLFFYNHEKAKTMKEFSKKWLWYMVLGLVAYVVIFSIIGFAVKALNGKPLYGTMDGSNESSTFAYPFIDWYHGVGFFKPLPAWLDCSFVLILVTLVIIGFDYFYTFIVLKLNKASKQMVVNY